MTADINTINPQPVQTAPSVRAGSRMFVDAYNSGRDYDSLTGKRNVGLLDPADVSGELKPTLVTVGAGAVNVSLEELVSEWAGNLRAGVQEYNPNSMDVAVGTTASDVVDELPDTPVEGDLASGSTKILIQLGTGEAAGFASHVGKPILISKTNSDALPLRTYIRSVDTVNDTITPVYPLDEIPPSTGTVNLLQGFTQEIGGNTMLPKEVIMATDFGNGASHRAIIHKAQPIGGYTFADGQDKAKQMLDFKIQGHTKPVEGLQQVIPMTVKGTYGKAPVS